MDENKPEDTLAAAWCVDSESGLHYLLDFRTGQIIARKDEHGNIIRDRG